jgi:hypothetical protein
LQVPSQRNFPVALLLALIANRSQAVDFGPAFPLAEQDRLAIEQGLGAGVVGEAIATPKIENPAAYFSLTPVSRTYRYVAGPNRGKKEILRSFPIKQGSMSATWHQDLGGGEVGFLDATADGSFVMVGTQDSGEGVLTRYSPPEPVLLKGLAAGEARMVRMGVRVWELKQPEEVIHEGWLDVVYRYLGAYRLKVPAGTFDTVLIKSTFKGEIGPARVDDIQYRFFARNTGMVATVEQRDIVAFLVYRPHTEVAKVLAAKSD